MISKDSIGVYNRAPVFYNDNCDYWKVCIIVQIQQVDMEVLNVVANEGFQPYVNSDGVDGVIIDKCTCQLDNRIC